MCGLAGFFDPAAGAAADAQRAVASRMAETLRHRGPDDTGAWVDAEAGIGLGHRRLAIVDLSPAGHQPMLSADGRYCIAYNGEIYNHGGIRRELEGLGHAFRGHSDTEVVLAAVVAWGVEAALKRFVGMFAFALWDRVERRLFLARDRLGEKPLYYGWQGGVLLFASELKAMRAHPSWRGEVDRGALALLLRHNYIPAPHSIYRDIFKLMPGSFAVFDADAVVRRDFSPWPDTPGRLSPRSYWTLHAVVGHDGPGRAEPDSLEATDRLDVLLREAVKGQMVADVPLGALLSGGVDSSAVVAAMQAQSATPVRTFTIGYEEREYNEAHHARAVAHHLGTDHRELVATPADALALIPRLPEVYDEPFADSSQIPTLLVSHLARTQVTVTLSGDGGDELFGGYPRYIWAERIWRKWRRLPAGLRAALGRAIRGIPVGAWDRLLAAPAKIGIGHFAVRHPGAKAHRVGELLAAEDAQAVYRRLLSHWPYPEALARGAREPETAFTRARDWPELPEFTERCMFLDTLTYLPDDVLVKVDRASMNASLEVRVPLLDHRIVEFAWSLPLSLRVRRGRAKWLLREVLNRYVPRELIERPKMGFSAPIDRWLRGPLRDWAEDLLGESRLQREGFFDPAPIRRKWQEHLSGRHDWQYPLWDVLMFQAWQSVNPR